tara:strand:+ start:48 stop:221 length:174 start_codon:yes stop_codon:yes gene_type:complete
VEYRSFGKYYVVTNCPTTAKIEALVSDKTQQVILRVESSISRISVVCDEDSRLSKCN